MEKPLQEEDLKELEDEIDLAVDRLFVEKRIGGTETPLEPSPLDLSITESEEREKEAVDNESTWAASLPPSPPPPPQAPSPQTPPSLQDDLPPSYLKWIDQFEAHLLSLEWEITEEKIDKALEGVNTLRPLFKRRGEMVSVLGWMEDVLHQMKGDPIRIHPSMIKFLLDGKETLKLLLRKEEDPELTLYQNLALNGFEARFALLKSEKERSQAPGPQRLEGQSPVYAQALGEENEEGIVPRQQAFLARAEDLLGRIDQRLREIEKKQIEVLSPSKIEAPLSRDITVFRVYGRLYAVASESVWKVFKVPPAFQEKYGHLPRIRIQDEEVCLIDLSKILPGETWDSGEVTKLLMIRGEGAYKGLLIDEVLKRLRIVPELGGGEEKPLLGKVHWVLETRPVEIPILDPKSL